jgi:hypothetical protein
MKHLFEIFICRMTRNIQVLSASDFYEISIFEYNISPPVDTQTKNNSFGIESSGGNGHKKSVLCLAQLVSLLFLKIQKNLWYKPCRGNIFLSICFFSSPKSHQDTFPRRFSRDLPSVLPIYPVWGYLALNVDVRGKWALPGIFSTNNKI